MRRSRTVIGWFAIAGLTALCDGDACVIAGSQAAMRKIVARRTTRDALSMTIKKTRFGEIMTGLRLGAAYCFDEEVYNRFFPLAQLEGLKLGPQDFSDPGPHGLHFFRVQWCWQPPDEPCRFRACDQPRRARRPEGHRPPGRWPGVRARGPACQHPKKGGNEEGRNQLTSSRNVNYAPPCKTGCYGAETSGGSGFFSGAE